VGAALVGTRAALVAGSAVIAGRPSVPCLRKRSAAVGLPAKPERARAFSQCLGGVRQGMCRQRKLARAPAWPLVLGSRNADQLFALAVVALEFGIRDRPVGGDTEPALHLHGVGMQAMRLAGEMQRAAADATDMLVFVHQPDAVRYHRPQATASRRQQRLRPDQSLPRRKRDLPNAVGLLRKVTRLPIGFCQGIVGRRVELWSGLEQEYR